MLYVIKELTLTSWLISLPSCHNIVSDLMWLLYISICMQCDISVKYHIKLIIPSATNKTKGLADIQI